MRIHYATRNAKKTQKLTQAKHNCRSGAMLNNQSVHVLIVEDELIVALNLSKELENIGYVVVGLAASETEALSMAIEHQPDIILMDINLEDGGSGLEAAKKIRAHCKAPVIYLTAYSSDKIVELAGKTNPYGYILKPYNVREVNAVISTSLIRSKYKGQIKASEARLRFALKAAELEVIEINRADNSISIELDNKVFGEMGFTKHMPKEDFLALFVKEDANILDTLLIKGLPFSRRAKMIRRIKNSDRYLPERYLDVYLSHIIYQNGCVQIGAIQDVSEAQHNITSLKVSDSILHQMNESVIILDASETIQKINPAFCELTGYSYEEVIGQHIYTFLLQERKADKKIAHNQGLGKSNNQAEVTVLAKDGTYIHTMMTISELLLSDSETQLIITLTDISRLVEAEKSLNKIAFTDALTSFGNRAYFNSLLKTIHQTEINVVNHCIALFFIDLDSFKQINDTLGHEFGDRVLVEFAKRLRSVFRDDDHLVRLGGDEFVALLRGNYDLTSLEKVGNKVLSLFEKDFLIDGNQLTVSCSLGIAYSTSKNFDAEKLLKQADAAMYQAKKQGKNAFRFYDEALAKETQYRVFIEQGLQNAISNNLISVYLQPIVDTKGDVKSVEALCRWYDKDIGFIAPADFIPIAEETHLIHSLGFKVLNESMLIKKQLNEAGYSHIVVNINLSEKQLQNKNTYNTICELLAQYSLAASDFVIEITESVLHSTSSDAHIKRLSAEGFTFALDDFGTGYSALSRLHDYTIDIVKIDKSFIDMLLTNTKQNTITAAIIALGKKLGHKVVAEGVENEQQSNILMQMGCESMQGFYYAKPMPIHELLKFLDS